MMVKWANDGLLQANDGQMVVNDGEMLVNDGEMSVWSYTHFSIIDEPFTSINDHHLTSIFLSLAWSKQSFAHLAIIEKLHRLFRDHVNSKKGGGEGLPVSSDVEGDGEGLLGRNAGEGGVEGQLAHRDTHALGSQVTQSCIQ